MRPGRWAWAGALLVALLVALLIAVLSLWPAAEPVVAATALGSAQAVPPSAHLQVGPPAPTPALLQTLLAPAPALTPQEAPVWDSCGVGRLPRPPGSTASGADLYTQMPAHLGADPTAAALERLVLALDAGNPRAQAAAVMLRGSDARGVAAVPALAALAASSADPVVASWLLMRCGRQAPCSPADAQRWADLEPDNLAAWLRVAEHEPARLAEVLQRAPHAKRFDLHQMAWLDTVLQALPADVLPYVQMQVWAVVVGVEAAIAIPNVGLLGVHCRAPLEPGSARQQDCAAIAQVLLAPSDNLIGRGVGLRIAERSGTPKAQTDAWRAEMAVGQQRLWQSFDAQQPLSCKAVTQTQAWLQLRKQLGELGALRALNAQAAASAPPR